MWFFPECSPDGRHGDAGPDVIALGANASGDTRTYAAANDPDAAKWAVPVKAS